MKNDSRKNDVIRLYETNKYSIIDIAIIAKVNKSTAYLWISKYNAGKHVVTKSFKHVICNIQAGFSSWVSDILFDFQKQINS